jgi:hypothetical protein
MNMYIYTEYIHTYLTLPTYILFPLLTLCICIILKQLKNLLIILNIMYTSDR